MSSLGARLRALAGAVAFGVLASPAAAQTTPVQTAPLLDAMFQDHAVLQRDRPIPVWGQARPREQVTLSFNGRTLRVLADRAGQWRVSLPATPAGGPYTLTARTRSGGEQTISDVLIGDVFLCSGQSNMEWSVQASTRGQFEASRAANDRLRLMAIEHAASPTPRADFEQPVAWRIAAPDTVGPFSGACYFMARDLQATTNAPIGLIKAAWGGSNIQTWIGEAGVRRLGGFDESLDLLSLYARDPAGAYRSIGDTWMRWWRQTAPQAGEPWAANAPGDWRPMPEPMRDWKKWGVAETANLNGMVWFRRTVTLTPAQAAQSARISLGAIDEVDQTWINGTPIANSFGWSVERHYDVPEGVLRAGENAIVVNVLSTWDMGGMYGPPENQKLVFADGSEAALGGEWRYQLAPEATAAPPRAPWESVGGLTSLYNAMIAPIGPYAIRGAAWYQGETNAGAPGDYAAYLAALMASWRAQFGADLPFLVVQLPNFGAPVTAPTASGWADLRDAQRRAVRADAHAGLVVTIDVGDAKDLHPPAKQPVGARLARAARHVIYGEALSPSGPEVQNASRVGANIVVRFENVTGALLAYSARGPNAFELCGETQSSCRFVEAVIRGGDVVLSGDGAAATRVRYCWGDAPVCNLYDGSGLPAGPFELRIE